MNARSLGLAAAALTFVLSGGAMAQGVASDAGPSLAANTAGKFLYDTQGHTIGSVRNLTDGGRTAVVMIGMYGQPGSHETQVSARALSVVDGKVTLQSETVEALNTHTRR